MTFFPTYLRTCRSTLGTIFMTMDTTFRWGINCANSWNTLWCGKNLSTTRVLPQVLIKSSKSITYLRFWNETRRFGCPKITTMTRIARKTPLKDWSWLARMITRAWLSYFGNLKCSLNDSTKLTLMLKRIAQKVPSFWTTTPKLGFIKAPIVSTLISRPLLTASLVLGSHIIH